MRNEDELDGVYSTQTISPLILVCVCQIIIIIFSSYIKCVYDYIISQLTWLGYVIVLLSMGLSPQGYTVRYILVEENIRYTQ